MCVCVVSGGEGKSGRLQSVTDQDTTSLVSGQSVLDGYRSVIVVVVVVLFVCFK